MFFFNYLILSFQTAPMSLSYLKSSIFSECMSRDNFLERRPDLYAYSNVTVLRHFPCVWVEFYALSMQVGVTQKSLQQFKWIICRNPKKKIGFLSLQEKRVRSWRQQRQIFFFSFLKDCKTTARHASTLPEPSQLHHCDLFSHEIFIFAILLRIPRFMWRWPPR